MQSFLLCLKYLCLSFWPLHNFHFAIPLPFHRSILYLLRRNCLRNSMDFESHVQCLPLIHRGMPFSPIESIGFAFLSGWPALLPNQFSVLITAHLRAYVAGCSST